ncbi:MAG: immunity 40 family protein [Streptococcaceae bacterium]|jgi:hypothetical protein|nr:immunity 40 family protein [Streptococcaceae bacterium]
MLQDILSEELIKRAVNLEDMGIKELAWSYSDVLTIIRLIKKKGYIISGGDVYKKSW